MQFYDTHMHSRLSFDSNEDPVNYINETTEVLTFTDHLDLENTIFDKRDDIPDFDQLFGWQKQFKTSHNVDLLAGVEVGFVPGQKERLEAIVSAYDFDIKLLSCHQNSEYDYMDEVDEKPEVMMAKYMDQLLRALDEMSGFQIMTHFDYGFRIHDMTVNDIQKYEKNMVAIFKKCIDNNLAFELNSKSLIKYHNEDLYEWAIPIYQSLGGKLFSIGSDAHEAKDHFLAFDKSIALLEKFGVTEVAQFKKQQLSLYPLAKLKQEL